MNDLKGWLFGRVLRLQGPGLGTRWYMTLFNVDSGHFEAIGSTTSPLLAPGPAALAAEMICFPGNPPDPVALSGDYVWLRRYQPNFTLSPRGDITMVEGR